MQHFTAFAWVRKSHKARLEILIFSSLLSTSSPFQSLTRQHSTPTKMPPYLKEPIFNGSYPSLPSSFLTDHLRENLLHSPYRYLPRYRPRHEIEPYWTLCPHNWCIQGCRPRNCHLLRKSRRRRNRPCSTLLLRHSLLRTPRRCQISKQTCPKNPRTTNGRHVLRLG
jgi:hypothetical protein